MDNKLAPIEHSGHRVITTELLAQVYETDTDRIKQNFNRNKDKFKEGIHYFKLEGELLKNFKNEVSFSDLVGKNASCLYLWTERGANRHCKILDTPKAWEQFDNLEETYFLVKEYSQNAIPGDLKQTSAETRLNYSRAKVSDMWLKIADRVPVDTYKEICIHYASTALAGKPVLPLPETKEHTYTAEEVGKMLGVSGNKIGRIANENHLKTPEYGVEVWDKAKFSSKQVPSWRYNQKGIDRIKDILDR